MSWKRKDIGDEWSSDEEDDKTGVHMSNGIPPSHSDKPPAEQEDADMDEDALLAPGPEDDPNASDNEDNLLEGDVDCYPYENDDLNSPNSLGCDDDDAAVNGPDSAEAAQVMSPVDYANEVVGHSTTALPAVDVVEGQWLGKADQQENEEKHAAVKESHSSASQMSSAPECPKSKPNRNSADDSGEKKISRERSLLNCGPKRGDSHRLSISNGNPARPDLSSRSCSNIRTSQEETSSKSGLSQTDSRKNYSHELSARPGTQQQQKKGLLRNNQEKPRTASTHVQQRTPVVQRNCSKLSKGRNIHVNPHFRPDYQHHQARPNMPPQPMQAYAQAQARHGQRMQQHSAQQHSAQQFFSFSSGPEQQLSSFRPMQQLSATNMPQYLYPVPRAHVQQIHHQGMGMLSLIQGTFGQSQPTSSLGNGMLPLPPQRQQLQSPPFLFRTAQMHAVAANLRRHPSTSHADDEVEATHDRLAPRKDRIFQSDSPALRSGVQLTSLSKHMFHGDARLSQAERVAPMGSTWPEAALEKRLQSDRLTCLSQLEMGRKTFEPQRLEGSVSSALPNYAAFQNEQQFCPSPRANQAVAGGKRHRSEPAINAMPQQAKRAAMDVAVTNSQYPEAGDGADQKVEIEYNHGTGDCDYRSYIPLLKGAENTAQHLSRGDSVDTAAAMQRKSAEQVNNTESFSSTVTENSRGVHRDLPLARQQQKGNPPHSRATSRGNFSHQQPPGMPSRDQQLCPRSSAVSFDGIQDFPGSKDEVYLAPNRQVLQQQSARAPNDYDLPANERSVQSHIAMERNWPKATLNDRYTSSTHLKKSSRPVSPDGGFKVQPARMQHSSQNDAIARADVPHLLNGKSEATDVDQHKLSYYVLQESLPMNDIDSDYMKKLKEQEQIREGVMRRKELQRQKEAEIKRVELEMKKNDQHHPPPAARPQVQGSLSQPKRVPSQSPTTDVMNLQQQQLVNRGESLSAPGSGISATRAYAPQHQNVPPAKRFAAPTVTVQTVKHDTAGALLPDAKDQLMRKQQLLRQRQQLVQQQSGIQRKPKTSADSASEWPTINASTKAMAQHSQLRHQQQATSQNVSQRGAIAFVVDQEHHDSQEADVYCSPEVAEDGHEEGDNYYQEENEYQEQSLSHTQSSRAHETLVRQSNTAVRIQNMSAATTMAKLRALACTCGPVHTATFLKGSPGQAVIVFKSSSTADSFCHRFNNAVIDRARLTVDLIRG